MKILFHITGYKSPEQFSWLHRAIYNEEDLYLIHIDQKAPHKIHEEYRAIVGASPNVMFIPSISIAWGGVGLIRAEMQAIDIGLRVGHDWRYLVNLTAQDYPVLPLSEIRTRLEKAWPANFVGCSSIRSVHWSIRKRRWFRHVERRDRRHWTPLPLWPRRDVKMDWYGPWWHILTRDFCKWWLSSKKANRYYQAHKPVGMPDEMLIQNLIKDSPFKDSVRPECKHAIIWRYPWEPRKDSAHPSILTMNDLPYITSSDAFFARKFDYSIDQGILCALAERIQALKPHAFQ